MTSEPSMQAMVRAAGRAVLDLDPEHPLQALRPGHRSPAFGQCPFPRARCRGMPNNPDDGHALAETLEQAEILGGVSAQRCRVDRGYIRASRSPG